tara:strand:+ start:9572 stop:10141 length:570 start_codon:yes stop_codon:yes gene_type:complete
MEPMPSDKNLKVQFPEHINELTVEQYQRYLKVDTEDVTFSILKAAEIFLGIPLRTALTMQSDGFFTMMSELLEMIGQKNQLTPIVEYRGIEYGFITNIEEMTLGEYVDLDEYLSDMDTLHKTVAVLYRPITQKLKERYTIEPYEPNDGYKDFPLGVALGALVFFCDLSKELSQHTQTSLEIQIPTLEQT